MKNKFKPTILLVACCTSLMINQSFGQNPDDSNPIPSNSASCPSIATPIILSGITKYDEVKFIQQDYIRKHYEDYHIVATENSLPKNNSDIFIQTFFLEDNEGNEVTISFDITDSYKSRNRKYNQELKNIVEDLEKSLKSTKKLLLKTVNDKSLKEDIQSIQLDASKLLMEELKKLGKKSSDQLTDEEKKKISESINSAMKEKIDAINEKLSKDSN